VLVSAYRVVNKRWGSVGDRMKGHGRPMLRSVPFPTAVGYKLRGVVPLP